MKRIITSVLLLLTAITLIFSLLSCELLDRFTSKEEETIDDAPAPLLDLSAAVDNLRSNGYVAGYYDENERQDPGVEVHLYAYERDDSSVYFYERSGRTPELYIYKYKDEELARLYYENESTKIKNKISEHESTIEYLKLVRDDYSEEIDKLIEESGVIMEGEVSTLDDSIEYFRELIKELEKSVVGIDGCYVWYGHEDLIKATYIE